MTTAKLRRRASAQGFGVDAPENADRIGREGGKEGDGPAGAAAVVRHAGPRAPGPPDEIVLVGEERDHLVHGHLVDGKLVGEGAFGRETAAVGIDPLFQTPFQFQADFFGDGHCALLFQEEII